MKRNAIDAEYVDICPMDVLGSTEATFLSTRMIAGTATPVYSKPPAGGKMDMPYLIR
jgi:hypothetical protein